MSANLISKCRTCLDDSNDCFQMLDYVEERYNIVEMLDCIVPQIDIKTTQFSNLLCRNCVNKLLASFKFQQLCIETNNRLHDLLGIPLFETEPEQILNPLVGALIVKIEQEVEQYDSFKFEVPTDELVWRMRSDNDVSGSDDTISSGCIRLKKNTFCYKKKHDYPSEICNTNITSEKTVKAHMLTHRNGEVSITKITLQNDCKEVFEEQEFLDVHRVNFNENKDGRNNNEVLKSADKFQEMPNEAKEKLTRIIVKEELEIASQTYEEFIDFDENAELVNKDYGDSRNNFEKKLLSNLGEKETKSIDFVNTVIGEVEKNCSNAQYLCETCGKAFDHPYYLKRHSSVVHSSTRPYECKICKYRFYNTTLLKGHMTKHKKCLEYPKSLNYSCIVCQRSYKSIKSLTEHTIKKHPEIKRHACDQCGKIFNHTASLNKHMQVHNVNRYQCNQCGKNLSNSTNLRHHKESHAGRGRKKYWCSECPSHYYIRSDLIRHEIIYHSNFENLEKPNKVNDTRLDVHRITDNGGEEVECSKSKKEIHHQCPNCPKCLEKQLSTSSHCKIQTRKDLFTNTK